MDLETQEYIKDILINWASINKQEIEENQRMGMPYVQQLKRIVPNMEQAIYLADCKVREHREKLQKIMFPDEEKEPIWRLQR